MRNLSRRVRLRAKHSRPRRVPRRLAEPLPPEIRRLLRERCRVGPEGRPKEGWE